MGGMEHGKSDLGRGNFCGHVCGDCPGEIPPVFGDPGGGRADPGGGLSAGHAEPPRCVEGAEPGEHGGDHLLVHWPHDGQ